MEQAFYKTFTSTILFVHLQIDSLIDGQRFAFATPYCMRGEALLMASDMVAVPAIVFGLLVNHSSSIFFRFIFSFHPLITYTTTQHCMSISFARLPTQLSL